MDATLRNAEYIQLKVRKYHWKSPVKEPFDTILYTWIKKDKRHKLWEKTVCLSERMVHLNEDT